VSSPLPPIGFSGLSGLVSDLDELARKHPFSQRAATPAEAQLPAHRAQRETPPVGRSSTNHGWLWGVGALVVLFALVANSEDRERERGSDPGTPPMEAPGYDVSAPIDSPYFAEAPAEEPVEEPTLYESVPPVGEGQLLSTAQISYCLAEEIRILAADPVVNDHSQRQVDRFNAMVNDYNGRCGRYRYRRDTLDRARYAVERVRSTLEAEGRARF
jgi:hypothetical protein